MFNHRHYYRIPFSPTTAKESFFQATASARGSTRTSASFPSPSPERITTDVQSESNLPTYPHMSTANGQTYPVLNHTIKAPHYSLFCLSSFCSTTFFYKKIADFSGIQTHIDRVEGHQQGPRKFWLCFMTYEWYRTMFFPAPISTPSGAWPSPDSATAPRPVQLTTSITRRLVWPRRIG